MHPQLSWEGDWKCLVCTAALRPNLPPSRLLFLPFLHEEGPLGIRTLEKMRHMHLSTSPLENSPRSCSYCGGWERQGFGGDRRGPVWGSPSKEAKEQPAPCASSGAGGQRGGENAVLGLCRWSLRQNLQLLGGSSLPYLPEWTLISGSRALD